MRAGLQITGFRKVWPGLRGKSSIRLVDRIHIPPTRRVRGHEPARCTAPRRRVKPGMVALKIWDRLLGTWYLQPAVHFQHCAGEVRPSR